MRILIVSQYYYPEQFQINEIAPELVRRGHEVTVLTGLPNYPQGDIYPGYENRGGTEEIINGVRVIRVPLRPRKSGSVNLAKNYLSFVREGNKAAKRIKDMFDVVLCYELSPVTQVIPASRIAKKQRIPLLLYCLDIWPDCAMAHVMKGPVYGMIRVLSKYSYNLCDYIAVTSRPFIDYLSRNHGFDRNKMSYIPQHADESYLKLDLSSPDNGISDFMYAGNLGLGQRVDVIIRAVAELKDMDFKVHIVGDGSQRQALETLVKQLEVEDKVIFYGNQKRDDMPTYYQKADALLLTLRGDNAVGNTMPGKLQTYMACGKPIFGAINGAADETIRDAHCGACVQAGDYEGLACLMMSYIDNPANYKACGKNAKDYFEKHFTLKQYCDDLERLLEKIT